jgi:hypothetical protein
MAVIFFQAHHSFYTASRTHKEITMEKVIVDCSTGEQTVVPLTDEEIAELEAAAARAEADRLAAEQEAADKAAARQAILDKLGLTAEEAAVLLG